ncbi:hypothetical protein KAFR_0E01700 [Kazachstania africana CBS 2517]|uniref:NADH-cytochrome b5 reductase n=1 Tax=Kazachstania africana (strain ATCC 22294 / BCRC 22015 / CBS 2517 / CECT 1963 / NBRC 1671 / NRRL Y-8276) TaxID=1071382 RepID=H2AVC4_KAZAF|nr:hypothetical protein KAFR_0E01700 [Kazachstania africana CBS 2517]CCF58324.1 hypothetical protein KAFR_0E01700 [Kazachstania africana CBS 2517]
MLSRLSRPNAKFVPYALGAAAIATAAYLYTTKTNSAILRNEVSKIFKGNGEWIDLTVDKIIQESHDTKRFFFKFPQEDAVSGLTLTSALFTKFTTETGEDIIRPYTPVSDLETKGYIEFVIKHYDDGKMTPHLFNLKPNDHLAFKGPIKKWPWELNSFEEITLLGGGTGITPLYQLIHHVLQNKNEKTKIQLVYANKTSGDVLLKKELNELQEKYPERFKVTYFVDKLDTNEKGDFEVGFISKKFLEQNIAKPNKNTHIFVCGPPPFMEAYSGNKTKPTEQGPLTGILRELGYSEKQVFKY